MKHYTSFVKLAAITALSVNCFISDVHAAPTLNDPNTWTGGAGTSAWGTNINWSKGTFPNAAGVNILFDDTDILLNGRSIALGANRTIGSLENTSVSNFSITGNTLIFNNSGNGSQLIHNSAGTLTIGSAVSLGDSLSTYVDAASGILTMGGIISGTNSAYSFTKTGGGRLILSAANTYTGATIIEDGVLELTGSGNLAGTSGVSLAEGAILNFTGGTTITFSKIISGDGEVIIDRTSGTLTFSGANTYTGATTINSGAVSISGSVAASAINLNGGALTISNASGVSLNTEFTVASGTTLSLTNGLTIGKGINGTGTVSITNGKILIVNNANAATISANFAATSGILTKTGTSTLTLSGTNAYTGATNINGGKLIIAGSHTGSTAAITVNGGDLDITGSIANGAMTVTNGTVTLSGTKGTGTVTLNSAGIFNYATTQQTASIGTVNVNNGGIFNLQNGSSGFLGNNALNVYAGGEFRVNTDYTRTAAVGGNVGGSIVIASGKTLTFDNASGSLIITPAITGAGSILKTGAGTFILSGTSTYTGATTISSGILTISALNGISADSLITVNSGAGLTLTNGITINQGIAGTGTVTLGSGKTLTVNNDADATIAAIIAGSSGAVVKDGDGTLTLSGINTYSGTTTVNSGTLAVTGKLGTGAVTLASDATLALNFSGSQTFANAYSGTGTISVNLANTSDVLTLSGNATGFAGTYVFGKGTVTLSNAAAAKIISDTGNLTIITAGAKAVDTFTFDGGNVQFNGPVFNGTRVNGTITADKLVLNSGNVQIDTTAAGDFAGKSFYQQDDTGGLRLLVSSSNITGSAANLGLVDATGNAIDGMTEFRGYTCDGSGIMNYTYYIGGSLVQNDTGLYLQGGTLSRIDVSRSVLIDGDDDTVAGGSEFHARLTGNGTATFNAKGTVMLNSPGDTDTLKFTGKLALTSTAGTGKYVFGTDNAFGTPGVTEIGTGTIVDLNGTHQTTRLLGVSEGATLLFNGGTLESLHGGSDGTSFTINGIAYLSEGSFLNNSMYYLYTGGVGYGSKDSSSEIIIDSGAKIQSLTAVIGNQSDKAGVSRLHQVVIKAGGQFLGDAFTAGAAKHPTQSYMLSLPKIDNSCREYWTNYDPYQLDSASFSTHYTQWENFSKFTVAQFGTSAEVDVYGELKDYTALILGDYKGANGTLNVYAGGHVQIDENIHVGNGGTGTMNVYGGLVENNGKFQIATTTTGDGTVNVYTGGKIDVKGYTDGTDTIPGIMFVGGWNKGLLNIDGGTVSAEDVVIGYGRYEDETNSYIGDGTLLLHNNGILMTSAIEAGIGKYQLTVDGGTIVAKQNNDDFITGFTNSISDETLKIDSNGLTLDTQAYSVGINAGNSFSGAGGLTKTGSGTLTLRSANTYTGETTVAGGSMVIASGASLGNTNLEVEANTFLTVNGIIENDSKTTIVNQGGTLYGTGALNGNTAVFGVLSPGDGNGKIGTLSFTNNLTLNSTASVRIEIDHQTLDFDKLIIGGNIDLGGALLDIDLIGLSLFDPDTKIDLFTASTLTGEWGSGNEYTDTDNRVWKFGFENGIGFLSIGTIIPEPSAYGLFLALSAMVSMGLRRRKDFGKNL